MRKAHRMASIARVFFLCLSLALHSVSSSFAQSETSETTSSKAQVYLPVVMGSGSTQANGNIDDTTLNGRAIAVGAQVASWAMDETGWTNATNGVLDSSGNNLHGTAINGATTSNTSPALSGNVGTCGYGAFNGNNQFVNVPYNAALNPAGSFTVAAWARVTGGAGTWRSILTSRWESSSFAQQSGYILYAGENNTWQFWTGKGTSSWQVVQGSAIQLDSWTHVVGRFESQSVSNGIYSGVMSLFINGQLVTQVNNAAYRPNDQSPLTIGAGGGTGNRYYFPGNVDEVQVYNTALTDADILQLKNATHNCQTTPPVTSQATVMVVHAHADDEGIFGGGVLPYYAQTLGLKVVDLYMTTRDPNGSYPLYSGSGVSRVQELRNAMDTYAGQPVGSGTVNALGHYVTGNITVVEGGMIDTGCCNSDPSGSWNDSSDGVSWGSSRNTTQLTPGYGNVLGIADGRQAAAMVIAREIRRFRPTIVASVHDLEGDYGHENHTATAIGTIEGYDLAADPNVVIEGLPAWRAQKLYLRGSLNDNYYRGANPANGIIQWGSFSPTAGLNALFQDRFETPSINGASPRTVANAGLDRHVSQSPQDVSSVFATGEPLDGHHSEWWTLYRSTVGADPVSTFTLAGDLTGSTYTNWARGDFFQNGSPTTPTPTPVGPTPTATPVLPTPTPVANNVAQGKSATQSSTGFSGVPARAVDGNTGGNYNNGSVTHTNAEANAWWQVDLGNSYQLSSIVLWNRTDCCADRLSNFYVFVSTSDMTGSSFTALLNNASVWRYQVTGQAPTQLTIPSTASGRFVRVQLAGTNYLSLAEVQVFGTPVGSATSYRYVKFEALSEINGGPWASAAEINILDRSGVALNRSGWTVTADSQESAGENGVANNVLDGNTGTIWHSQYVGTLVNYPHSLMIDMKAANVVGGFTYLPRQDGGVNGTVANYRLYLSNDGVTWGQPVAQGTFASNTNAKTVTLP